MKTILLAGKLTGGISQSTQVVKLGYLEPEIRSIAKRSMMALTTGSTDELFTRLPYRELSRPIYPLDGEFDAELELI
jgi:microcystin degradation protein MlrC